MASISVNIWEGYKFAKVETEKADPLRVKSMPYILEQNGENLYPFSNQNGSL